VRRHAAGPKRRKSRQLKRELQKCSGAQIQRHHSLRRETSPSPAPTTAAAPISIKCSVQGVPNLSNFALLKGTAAQGQHGPKVRFQLATGAEDSGRVGEAEQPCTSKGAVQPRLSLSHRPAKDAQVVNASEGLSDGNWLSTTADRGKKVQEGRREDFVRRSEHLGKGCSAGGKLAQTRPDNRLSTIVASGASSVREVVQPSVYCEARTVEAGARSKTPCGRKPASEKELEFGTGHASGRERSGSQLRCAGTSAGHNRGARAGGGSVPRRATGTASSGKDADTAGTKERSDRAEERRAAAQGAGGAGGGGKGLLDKMRARLAGSRFRSLNEALYTCSGAEAWGMMRVSKPVWPCECAQIGRAAWQCLRQITCALSSLTGNVRAVSVPLLTHFTLSFAFSTLNLWAAS
jgi:hypothetical protein